MNTFVKSTAIVLALATCTGQIFAQEKTKSAPKEKKQESIIIHKNGSTNEKVTVVIDGDKVTVNGKPVDEYKGDNIDIIRKDGFGMSMGAPMPMDGGWKMMGDDFMREIHSNKAFLGVMTKETEGGAKITEVTKESAAEKAGLKVDDVITKINDDKVTDADDLYKTIGKFKPEDKVTVTYKRAGKESTAVALLGENRQVRAFSWNNGSDNDFNFKMTPPAAPRIRGWGGDGDFWNDAKPRLGIQVQDTEDGKGVKVLDADEDEPAGKAGIEEDDIITSVNGKDINSVDDLREKMKDVKKGDTVKIVFLRDGKQQTADVKFPKDLKTTDL